MVVNLGALPGDPEQSGFQTWGYMMMKRFGPGLPDPSAEGREVLVFCRRWQGEAIDFDSHGHKKVSGRQWGNYYRMIAGRL